MKYLKLYKESDNKTTCDKCGWSWEIESGDERKYLCHKCGYDSKLGKFDITALKKWKKSN